MALQREHKHQHVRFMGPRPGGVWARGASAAAAPPCRQGPQGSPPPTLAAARGGASQTTLHGERTGGPRLPQGSCTPSAPSYPGTPLISGSLHPPGIPAPSWGLCTLLGSLHPCTVLGSLHPQILHPPGNLAPSLDSQVLAPSRGASIPKSCTSTNLGTPAPPDPAPLHPQTLHLLGSLLPQPRSAPSCSVKVLWGAPTLRGVPLPAVGCPRLPRLGQACFVYLIFFSLSAGRGKASPGSAGLPAPAKSRGDEPGLLSAFQPRICCCAAQQENTPKT